MNRMRVLFASDLHGKVPLYEDLLEYATSSPAEIIGLGGDLLPSLPPTKRYEEMIPYQKDFIHRFLLPFFRRILETTVTKRVFAINPGQLALTGVGISKLSAVTFEIENPEETLRHTCLG